MRTVDLFAGCGGMSLGFEMEDFCILEAHENWGPAIECYRTNFSHPVFETDLSEFQTILPRLEKASVELIIGGPPCQDFSQAGTRVEGDRADLTTTFALIVAAVKPKYFVMENVERCEKSAAYLAARKILQAAGYGLTERILNAARCGVPQRRKRFFSIGRIGVQDNFLNPILDCKMTAKEMTVRDYLGESLDIEYYYRHPRNYSRRGIFSVDEPAPTVRGVNRPVPEGYQGHPRDPISKAAALRPLTSRERALLQTFPPEFHLPQKKTDTELLIGNAVPVNLARFIATAITEFEHSILDSDGDSEQQHVNGQECKEMAVP